jgi:Flp pilus assembly protein TadG
MMEWWWARRAQRARGERGAILVEAAIVIPVIALIAFGIIEYGAAFADRNVVDTAGRAGGRAAANMAKDPYADYWALDAVASAINDLGLTNVTRVVVFKATTTSVISPACAAGTANSGGTTPCNVYPGSVLSSLSVVNYKTTNFGCGAGKLDNFWCPTTRINSGLAPDYVGIYIEALHRKITYVLPGDLTMKDTFITQLEPTP